MQRLMSSGLLTASLSRANALNKVRIISLPSSSLHRFLSTCSSSSGDATSCQEKTPVKSFSELVSRHGGWYPLAALSAVVMLSKEIFVVNEEMFLVSNFVFVVFAGYVMGADSLKAYIKEQHEERKKYLDDCADCSVAIYESKIARHQTKVDEVPVYVELKAEFATLSQQAAAAKKMKLRDAAYRAVVKKLNDIATREASSNQALHNQFVNDALDYVRNEWKRAPAEEHVNLINMSIEVLEGKSERITPERSPIYRILNKYIDQVEQEQKDGEAAAEPQKA